MPSAIEEIVTELADNNRPLLDSRLADLSNLNSAEVELLKQLWLTIGQERRRQIIFRLVELAENHFELDFDSIFQGCLTDEDAEVRSQAIEGLWENEEPSLISTLINLLEQDDSAKVQATAATALGNLWC